MPDESTCVTQDELIERTNQFLKGDRRRKCGDRLPWVL
jgi:hypothetical protein